MEANGLISQFKKAGLPVRVVERASDINDRLRDRAGSSPFLMDIRRRPAEEFVFRLGTDTEVNVVSVDRDLQQLVLSVKEHESVIDEMVYDAKLNKAVRRPRVVPESKRQFLMGMDECHLFMAPLPAPVTTVKDAHRILKPAAVVALSKKGPKTIRTGEWFLTPVDSLEERAEIEQYVKKYGARKKSGLGSGIAPRRGRLHIVDERVILGLREAQTQVRSDGRNQAIGSRVLRPREYARGVIRHPDHHAVKLKVWHRVTGNTETGGSIASTWID